MDIREYIGTEKELTHKQVKALAPGSRVRVHTFDRSGVHTITPMTVVQSGKKKILTRMGYKGYLIEKPIKEETERFCYTEDLR